MTDELQVRRPRNRTASLVMLMLDVLGLLVLIFVTTIVLGRFRAIFSDLEVTMPTMTAAVITVPRIVYALFFGAGIAGLIFKECNIANRKHTLTINIIALVIIIACLIQFVVAMFLPLITFGPGLGA